MVGLLAALTIVGLDMKGFFLDAKSPLTFFTVRGPCPMMNTLANHGYLPHGMLFPSMNSTPS